MGAGWKRPHEVPNAQQHGFRRASLSDNKRAVFVLNTAQRGGLLPQSQLPQNSPFPHKTKPQSPRDRPLQDRLAAPPARQ